MSTLMMPQATRLQPRALGLGVSVGPGLVRLPWMHSVWMHSLWAWAFRLQVLVSQLVPSDSRLQASDLQGWVGLRPVS